MALTHGVRMVHRRSMHRTDRLLIIKICIDLGNRTTIYDTFALQFANSDHFVVKFRSVCVFFFSELHPTT